MEFKILSEVTKHWNKTYLLRDRKDKFVEYVVNERVQIREDLNAGDSDMGICSIWMSLENYENFKISRPYSSQCITLMVPAPKQIVSGNFILYPLSDTVWLTYLATFILSVIAVHVLSILNHDGELRKLFTLHLISTALCVPVKKLPIKFRMRLIIGSWLLFALFFNLTYSTGFTSLLARPRFTLEINNLDVFLTTGNYSNCYSI